MLSGDGVGPLGAYARPERGVGQQRPRDPPGPSAWGRGKRRFLAPRPRPAAPPRHRARPRVRALRRGERARARARGGAAAAWGTARRGDGDVAAAALGAPESSLGVPRDAAREAAGGTMNVFRILGDLSHLLAMVLLLGKIWRSKSCAGERRPGLGGTGTRVGARAPREPRGARASEDFSEVVRHPRIRELLPERGFRLHGYCSRTSLALSSTPSGRCHCSWARTGGGGTPSPSLGGKSAYLEDPSS